MQDCVRGAQDYDLSIVKCFDGCKFRACTEALQRLDYSDPPERSDACRTAIGYVPPCE